MCTPRLTSLLFCITSNLVIAVLLASQNLWLDGIFLDPPRVFILVLGIRINMTTIWSWLCCTCIKSKLMILIAFIWTIHISHTSNHEYKKLLDVYSRMYVLSNATHVRNGVNFKKWPQFSERVHYDPPTAISITSTFSLIVVGIHFFLKTAKTSQNAMKTTPNSYKWCLNTIYIIVLTSVTRSTFDSRLV